MISNEKKYPLLDWFRMAAAILVVAIHTSPLSSFTPEGDFILTRIVARIAVPFFFLITGFFMGPEAEKKGWRCALDYSKKMAIIYAFSILLYLPLNIYTGYFKKDFSVGNLLKDLIFDGTFYHMWYLPAAMIGMFLVSALARAVGVNFGLAVTLLLYAVGLLGDSYYGVAVQAPLLKQMYDGLFLLFDYTRNGLFMAPVFLMEGMWIRRQRYYKRNQATGRQKEGNRGNPRNRESSWIVLLIGLLVSMGLLIGEGLTVNHYEWARHDSMYVTLPLVSYFLFGLLLRFNRGQDRLMRAASLIIYLIHPWMIVAVRGVAKALHIEELLIEQSFIHYLAVLACSVVAATLVCCLGRRRRKEPVTVRKVDFSEITIRKDGDRTDDMEKISDFHSQDDNLDRPYKDSGKMELRSSETGKLDGLAEDTINESKHGEYEQQHQVWPDEEEMYKRAWAKIDLGAVCHNCAALKKLLPDICEIMGIVKADGYGHGDVEVAKALNQVGINAFGVATIDEGIRLRRAGIKGEILILGYTDPELAKHLEKYHLSQTIVDNGYGQKLNAMGVNVKVHVGIDTGMHRLGIPAEDIEQVKALYRHRHLKIQGMFSHLCVSDSLNEENVAFTHDQITRFFRLVNNLQAEGFNTGKIHIQASFGIVNYTDLPCHYARAGLALYGVLDGEGKNYKKRPDIRPALSLYARIGAVKEIQAGDSVSYGRTFKAVAPMKIAAVTIGYADGIPRNLSGSGGWVLVNGRKAPVIGRVCMDQFMIDVSRIPDVTYGDRVTLIGIDGQEQITCEMFSDWCKTIPNEILCRLGTRISRIYG